MKIRNAVIGLTLAASLVLPASASGMLMMGGENIWTKAQAQMVGGDTTYVSLRTVTGLLMPEAEVFWEDGAAHVRADGLFLTVRPGENWMTVNDRALYIPYGVWVEDGRTMVPVRVLAQALGGQVEWDRETGVTLTADSERFDAAPYTEHELYWLSRIISAESQGEPLLGKLAVGTVVLNRVASDEFPDSIYDVIFDRQWGVQFEPVANGTVYNEPTEESVLAAKMCLEGARAAEDSLYFLAPELANNHWTMENREYVTTIGCHWFYR